MVTSLYIHIPFCLSKCSYCDFFSICNTEVPYDYVDALCNEIVFRLNKYNVNELDTIYIGGGTPSLLKENDLSKIFDTIIKNTNINKNAEITIEVNPDDITENLLSVYKKSYINRISCGIQSLNEKALSFCGRRADAKTNLKAIELFSKYWNKELSIDLICGLPEENEKTFLETLQTVVKYKPGHISMYSLTIESETPMGILLENGELNYNFDFSDELWLKGYDFLVKNGYEQYEVSNFCKPGKDSKHNLKYWCHKNYIGCGCGGTGTVYNNDGTGNRWTNITDIKKYISFWNGNYSENLMPVEIEYIDLQNSKFEFFMMGLRKRSGVKQSDYYKIFNELFPSEYMKVFNKWNINGLLEIDKNNEDLSIKLNEKGILFLNTLLEELL